MCGDTVEEPVVMDYGYESIRIVLQVTFKPCHATEDSPMRMKYMWVITHNMLDILYVFVHQMPGIALDALGFGEL